MDCLKIKFLFDTVGCRLLVKTNFSSIEPNEGCDYLTSAFRKHVISTLRLSSSALSSFISSILLDGSHIESIVSEMKTKGKTMTDACCTWIKSNLAWWGAAVPKRAKQPPHVVRAGFAFPLTGNSALLGKDCKRGVQSGYYQVANRGSANLSSVTLNYSAQEIDTESSPFKTFFKLFQALGIRDSSLPKEFIYHGSFNSLVTIHVAKLLGFLGIPYMATAASAAQLSSRTNYPTFCRLSLKTDVYVKSTIATLKFFNWKRFHILSTDDSFAFTQLKVTEQEATAAGISVESVTVAPFGLSENVPLLKQTAETYKYSQTRILLIIMIQGDARITLSVFEKEGLFKDYQLIVLGTDAWLTNNIVNGWSGHLQTIHGMLSIVGADSFPSEEYTTAVRNDMLYRNKSEAEIFQDANISFSGTEDLDVIRYSRFFAYGYESALIVIQALTNALKILQDVGVPAECLMHYGAVEVTFKLCNLNETVREEYIMKSNCSGKFNATDCVRARGVLNMLGTENSTNTHNPRAIFMFELHKATRNGLAKRIRLDESCELALAATFLRTYFAEKINSSRSTHGPTEGYKLGFRDSATVLYPSGNVTQTDAFVFPGNISEEYIVEVPADELAERKKSTCAKIDSEYQSFFMNWDRALISNSKGPYFVIVFLSCATLFVFGIVFTCYANGLQLTKAYFSVYRGNFDQIRFQKGDIFVIACIIIQHIQLFALSLSPRPTWTGSEGDYFRFTSVLGLYFSAQLFLWIATFAVVVCGGFCLFYSTVYITRLDKYVLVQFLSRPGLYLIIFLTTAGFIPIVLAAMNTMGCVYSSHGNSGLWQVCSGDVRLCWDNGHWVSVYFGSAILIIYVPMVLLSQHMWIYLNDKLQIRLSPTWTMVCVCIHFLLVLFSVVLGFESVIFFVAFLSLLFLALILSLKAFQPSNSNAINLTVLTGYISSLTASLTNTILSIVIDDKASWAFYVVFLVWLSAETCGLYSSFRRYQYQNSSYLSTLNQTNEAYRVRSTISQHLLFMHHFRPSRTKGLGAKNETPHEKEELWNYIGDSLAEFMLLQESRGMPLSLLQIANLIFLYDTRNQICEVVWNITCAKNPSGISQSRISHSEHSGISRYSDQSLILQFGSLLCLILSDE